jgi:tetratricopeptide (TPR) repeat protein
MTGTLPVSRQRLFRPLLIFFLLCAAQVRAAPATPESQDLTRARADYELGTRYWDLGQYDKALDAYRSAYAHRADPALLFNVAQCLRKLRRPSEALDQYRSYLRRAPRSPKRADVERIMKQLEEEIAAAPPTAPPPVIAAPPLPQPAPSVPVLAVATLAHDDGPKPLVHRPWFWAVAATVAAGAVTGILLATRRTENGLACDGCLATRPVPGP